MMKMTPRESTLGGEISIGSHLAESFTFKVTWSLSVRSFGSMQSLRIQKRISLYGNISIVFEGLSYIDKLGSEFDVE